MTLKDSGLQEIFDTIETHDLIRRIEHYTSIGMFTKEGYPLSEGGCSLVDDHFFKSDVYFALAEDDDEEPSKGRKFGTGVAETVGGLKARGKQVAGAVAEGAGKATKAVGGGKGGFWSEVRSGFSEQMGRDKKANEKPKSKLFEANPRGYWNQRGKLASELASARDEVEKGQQSEGKEGITKEAAFKLIGQDADGNEISGLSEKEHTQRNGILDQIGKGERVSNENKAQLKHLNGKLSIREKAHALGTDLDMVDFHVTQLINSGSAARRAVDPRLSQVAPPVGNWPDSMGGSKLKAAAQKNFKKVAAKMPESDTNSEDMMNAQFVSDRVKEQGGQETGGAADDKPGAAAIGGIGDKQYLEPGEKEPEGAQVHPGDKPGTRWYSISQHQQYEAAKKDESAAPEGEKKEGAVAVLDKPEEEARKIYGTKGEVLIDTGDKPETEEAGEPEREEAGEPEPLAEEGEPEGEPEEEGEDTEDEGEEEEGGFWQEIKDEWNEKFAEGRDEGEKRAAAAEIERADEVTAFIDNLVAREEQGKQKKADQAAASKAQKEAISELVDYTKLYGKQQAQKLIAGVKAKAGPKADAALKRLETEINSVKDVVDLNVDAAKYEGRKANVVARRASGRLGRKGRKALNRVTNILNDAVSSGKQTVGQASKRISDGLPKDKDEAIAVAQTLQAHALNMVEQLPSDTAVYDVIDNVAEKAVRGAKRAEESIHQARKRLKIPVISWGKTSILGRKAQAPTTADIYGVKPAPGAQQARSLTRRFGVRKSDDGYFEMDGYFYKEDDRVQLLLKELHNSLIPDSRNVVMDLDSYISKTEEEIRDPVEMLTIIDELLIPEYSKIVDRSDRN